MNWFRGTWVTNQWRFVVNGAVVDNLLTALGTVWFAVRTFRVKTEFLTHTDEGKCFSFGKTRMNQNCIPYRVVNTLSLGY